MTDIISWFANLLTNIYVLVSSNSVLSAFCLLGFFGGIICLIRQMLDHK